MLPKDVLYFTLKIVNSKNAAFWRGVYNSMMFNHPLVREPDNFITSKSPMCPPIVTTHVYTANHLTTTVSIFVSGDKMVNECYSIIWNLLRLAFLITVAFWYVLKSESIIFQLHCSFLRLFGLLQHLNHTKVFLSMNMGCLPFIFGFCFFSISFGNIHQFPVYKPLSPWVN